MPGYDCRNLQVWQMAMDICQTVYSLVHKFPAAERYALSDQLRRAVVSIPSNIAGDSIFEVRTQLELAARLGYTTKKDMPVDEIESVSKMLFTMIQKPRD